MAELAAVMHRGLKLEPRGGLSCIPTKTFGHGRHRCVEAHTTTSLLQILAHRCCCLSLNASLSHYSACCVQFLPHYTIRHTAIELCTTRAYETTHPIMVAPTVTLTHLNRADGSATYTHNGYSIIGAVNGPIEVQRRDELPEEAAIEVNVRPAMGVGSMYNS